jgi:hypothetical protein
MAGPDIAMTQGRQILRFVLRPPIQLLRVGFSETGLKRVVSSFKMTNFAPKSGLTTLIVAGIYPLIMGNGYISVAITGGRENTYP